MISVGELGEVGGEREDSETTLSRRLRAGVGVSAGRGVRGRPGARSFVVCVGGVGVRDMVVGGKNRTSVCVMRSITSATAGASERPVRTTTTAMTLFYNACTVMTILLQASGLVSRQPLQLRDECPCPLIP